MEIYYLHLLDYIWLYFNRYLKELVYWAWDLSFRFSFTTFTKEFGIKLDGAQTTKNNYRNCFNLLE
jgi:hypothetical protein